MAIFGLLYLVLLANLVVLPVALVMLPWAVRWIPWLEITAAGARRGRSWGVRAYAAMLAFGGVQWAAGLVAGDDVMRWLIPGIACTATAGVAVATLVAATLGCFAGVTPRNTP